jgi:hypothetical protein
VELAAAACALAFMLDLAPEMGRNFALVYNVKF